MKPVSDRCATIYSERKHAMIGVSPFNSFFSEEYLTRIFKWASETFEDFHVFVPDEATRYTLEAVGYTEAKARRKARRQANYLLNKIVRALAVAVPSKDIGCVLTNSILNKNIQYTKLLALVEKRFSEDISFRNDCLQGSRWVLQSQVNNMDALDEAAQMVAVKYFLEEMPLFMNAAEIVGTSASVFCYHQCPAILQQLYKDRDDGLISPEQGFLVIEDASLPPLSLLACA